MDIEVAHAIAPDARLVVVNARPTVEGSGAYEKVGEMFRAADRDYPGAVWSLSIGWSCDAFPTPPLSDLSADEGHAVGRRAAPAPISIPLGCSAVKIYQTARHRSVSLSLGSLGNARGGESR